MTTLEILEKHFELSKVKYPKESWKRFEECRIEQEFIQNAMLEYAQQEVNKNLVKPDVMLSLPTTEDIKQAYPINSEWSNEDKWYELGKIRGAEWMLAKIKTLFGNGA